MIIHQVTVDIQFLVELLHEIHGDVLLYVILVAGPHVEVAGMGDYREVVSVLLEVITLQVEVLFIMIAISGFSRCQQGAVELLFGLQVEHVVLISGFYSCHLFQLTLLIIYFYLADDVYRQVLQCHAVVSGKKGFTIHIDFLDGQSVVFQCLVCAVVFHSGNALHECFEV